MMAELGPRDCGPLCSEICDQVEDFVDQTLTPEQVQLVAAHVADCPRCAGQVSYELAVRTALRRSCAERAPEHLRDRVVAALRSETTIVVRALRREA